MKRVLMVAPFFPPRRRVGALRSYRLVRWLGEEGWSPAVVALDSSGTLTASEQDALRTVPVHRIPVGFDATEPSRSFTPSPAATSSSSSSKSGRRQGNTILDRLAACVDRNMPLDTWWPLFRLRERSIRRFAAAQRPDVVWSTGDPWSSHWLGWRLSKELGVPWVADYRDPWTLSRVRIRERSPFSERVDRRLERMFLTRATRVVLTCQAAATRYLERFPELAGRVHVVENSAFEPRSASLAQDPPPGPAPDSPDFAAPAAPAAPPAAAPARDGAFRMLFFGSFRRLSPLDPVLDMLDAVRKQLPNPPGATPPFRIHHIGPLLAEDRERVEARGLAGWFRSMEPVADGRFDRVLNSFDLLLLSTHPMRDDIIPAKLWEYLSVERPILSLCPNPEVGEWIDRFRAGRHLPDPHQAADALLAHLAHLAACRSDDQESGLSGNAPSPSPFPSDPVPAAERADRISARNMARRMARVLDEAAAAGRHGRQRP